MLMLKLMAPSSLSKVFSIDDEAAATKVASVLDNILELAEAESIKRMKSAEASAAPQTWVKFLA